MGISPLTNLMLTHLGLCRSLLTMVRVRMQEVRPANQRQQLLPMQPPEAREVPVMRQPSPTLEHIEGRQAKVLRLCPTP